MTTPAQQPTESTQTKVDIENIDFAKLVGNDVNFDRPTWDEQMEALEQEEARAKAGEQGKEDPPKEDPPKEDPPKEDPPKEDPPPTNQLPSQEELNRQDSEFLQSFEAHIGTEGPKIKANRLAEIKARGVEDDALAESLANDAVKIWEDGQRLAFKALQDGRIRDRQTQMATTLAAQLSEQHKVPVSRLMRYGGDLNTMRMVAEDLGASETRFSALEGSLADLKKQLAGANGAKPQPFEEPGSAGGEKPGNSFEAMKARYLSRDRQPMDDMDLTMDRWVAEQMNGR